MVIAIDANGDGVLHWRHYVHHHWSQWIAIGSNFLSPLALMAPMARTPNRYDTFAKLGLGLRLGWGLGSGLGVGLTLTITITVTLIS